MGYRFYMAIVNKKQVDEVSSLSDDKLREYFVHDDYFDIFKLLEYCKYEQIHELGKLCCTDFDINIFHSQKPLVNLKLNTEHDLWIMSKDSLWKLINWYILKIHDDSCELVENLIAKKDGSLNKQKYEGAVGDAWRDAQEIVFRNKQWFDKSNKWFPFSDWTFDHAIVGYINLINFLDWNKYSVIVYGY